MKKGKVFCDNLLCGFIIQNDDNEFIFTYTDEWFNDNSKNSISLTMPKSKKEYKSNILFPFFDGLIPEGYILELALKKFNLNVNDRMLLLLKTCNNPIGNISIKEAKDE